MVAAGTAVGEDLSALLQPMKVGPIPVANRMMMAGMSAGNKIDENGAIHPQMAAYLLERACGGPGLIAIGATRVAPVSVRTWQAGRISSPIRHKTWHPALERRRHRGDKP